MEFTGCLKGSHSRALSDDLDNFEVPHENTIFECLSDVAAFRRSQLFSRIFDERNCQLLEISSLISVTYCAYPNPIPRDRHAHLASAWCTTGSKRVATRSRECRIACTQRWPSTGSALAGILDGGCRTRNLHDLRVCLYGIAGVPRFSGSPADTKGVCEECPHRVGAGTDGRVDHLFRMGKTVGRAHESCHDAHFLPSGKAGALGRFLLCSRTVCRRSFRCGDCFAASWNGGSTSRGELRGYAAGPPGRESRLPGRGDHFLCVASNGPHGFQQQKVGAVHGIIRRSFDRNLYHV